MKAASITENKAIIRDKDGIPNFRSFEQVRAVFSDAEIVIMANHYLMAPWQWKRVEKNKFFGEPHDGTVMLPKKPKLKPNVPLREQTLERVAREV